MCCGHRNRTLEPPLPGFKPSSAIELSDPAQFLSLLLSASELGIMAHTSQGCSFMSHKIALVIIAGRQVALAHGCPLPPLHA